MAHWKVSCHFVSPYIGKHDVCVGSQHLFTPSSSAQVHSLKLLLSTLLHSVFQSSGLKGMGAKELYIKVQSVCLVC